MFILQLLVGAILICLTVIIHAVILNFLFNRMKQYSNADRLAFKKNWKVPWLVSSFQATNGFILFGWSAAFIFEIMSRLYEGDSRESV